MEGLARERESLAAWRALSERGRVLLHGGLANKRVSLAAWSALPTRGGVLLKGGDFAGEKVNQVRRRVLLRKARV